MSNLARSPNHRQVSQGLNSGIMSSELLTELTTNMWTYEETSQGHNRYFLEPAQEHLFKGFFFLTLKRNFWKQEQQIFTVMLSILSELFMNTLEQDYLSRNSHSWAVPHWRPHNKQESISEIGWPAHTPAWFTWAVVIAWLLNLRVKIHNGKSKDKPFAP